MIISTLRFVQFDSSGEMEHETVETAYSRDQVDDETLMLRVAKKDVDAYRALVKRHSDPALSFAERMVGDRGDAEDLTQEAFLTVWEEACNWKPKAKFVTWFRRVLYNLCIDFHRKSRPLIGVVELEASPARIPDAEKNLMSRELSSQVKDALQELPENQRAALVLFHYEGLSQAEAGDVLEVSVSALESLLFRARSTLRERLKKLNPNKGAMEA